MSFKPTQTKLALDLALQHENRIEDDSNGWPVADGAAAVAAAPSEHNGRAGGPIAITNHWTINGADDLQIHRAHAPA
jgi:hypothetical protein